MIITSQRRYLPVKHIGRVLWGETCVEVFQVGKVCPLSVNTVGIDSVSTPWRFHR